jgi:Flp pilus assembly protein TadD
MRHYPHIVRAFLGAAAITTLVAACEEETPPPKKVTVSAPATATATPTPAPSKQPEARVEAPKVEPVKVAQTSHDDTIAVDEDGKADELIGKARDAIDAGELNRALKLARLATKKAPSRSASWNTLGRVQLKRGERKDAIASFEKAVELNPSSSFAQNNLGLALIYDGKYDEAVDALEEATQLEPVEPYMWNNLGMAYEHLDRLDEARDAYKQAIAAAADGTSGAPAKENLVRLAGVKTVKPIKTAKAEEQPSAFSLPPSATETEEANTPVK